MDSLRVDALSQEVDSVRSRKLVELSKKWNNVSFDSSLRYSELSVIAAEKSQNYRAIALAYNAIALSYGYDYEPFKAWPYYEKAIEYYLLLDDQAKVGAMYVNSGVDYYLTKNLDTALVRFLSAIPYYEAADATNKLGPVYNNLAMVNTRLGLHEEAIDYYRKSRTVKQSIQDSIGIMNTDLNISSLYYIIDEYDSARFYAQRAYSASTRFQDLDIHSASSLTLGQVAAETNMLDSAIHYSQESHRIAAESGLARRRVAAAAALSAYLYRQQDYEQAVEYAQEALRDGSDVIAFESKAICYEVLAGNAEWKEDYAKAFEWKNLQLAYRDSANAADRNKRVASILTRYEQSVRKADLLAKEKALSESENDKNRLFAIAFGTSTLGVMVILFMVIGNFRTKRRREQVEARIREQVREIDTLREKVANMAEMETPENASGMRMSPEEVNALLKSPLTEREMEVLAMIASGRSNQQIADALFVSINTIKTHITRIYDKLEVHNRTEATVKATEMQLLD